MTDLATPILANPKLANSLKLAEWDLLVRQARTSGILARLFGYLRDADQLSSIPEPALKHFESASTLACRHSELADFEVRQIYRALEELETPIVLLKGAAYLISGLPAAEGRVFNDTDILVHKSQLALVEDALQHGGWSSPQNASAKDKSFPKQMREMPAMIHTKRQTVIDVHHTILPPGKTYLADTDKLFKAAKRIEGYEHLYTLCPEDMVLHSAVHLFHDGDFNTGLRDLTDIDLLLRDFPERNPKFWQRLTGRARNIGLSRSLFYALHCCSTILGTPVPGESLREAKNQARINRLNFFLMTLLLKQGLMPNHHSCESLINSRARRMLGMRTNYLRKRVN